jgi:hypothetical protein
MSNLTGTWINQYGSKADICDSDGLLTGTFRTALTDSSFYGRDYAIHGVRHEDCMSFAFTGATTKGDAVCAFTGVLRDGKLQTVFHVISDRAVDGHGKRPWPHAVITNADTFERQETE